MSDELNTKLSLDLDTGKLEGELEAITSEMNKALTEIGKMQKEMGKLGPNAGKSMKEVEDTIGKLNQSLKQTAQNMANSMEGKKAFSDVKSELENLIQRLGNLEDRVKTGLNPAAVNDMMNAVARLNDIFGRVNLGKLEISFKNVDASLEKVSKLLDEVIGKLGTMATELNKIDLGKIAAGSGHANAGDSSQKVVDGLKKEAAQAKLNEEAFTRLRNAKAEAAKQTA